MIGKATLKEYGFNTLEDYCNYIVDSQINGQHRQVKELFNKLSEDQKRFFIGWLKDNEIKFNYSGLY
jgi:hypothetical protein